MSFPITHAYVLNPPVSIGFPDNGGLSVTIPQPPPFQIPEGSEPSVTSPTGSIMPPVCISVGGDGNIIVSIPAG